MDWVKIVFEFETEYGVFRDAIHLPSDHTFTDEDIELMKQDRLQNWINFIKTAPAVVAPEPEPEPEIPVNG